VVTVKRYYTLLQKLISRTQDVVVVVATSVWEVDPTDTTSCARRPCNLHDVGTPWCLPVMLELRRLGTTLKRV